MTCPPLMPPPASATLKTLGKWSRPALALILGVRPNSPIHTTKRLIEHAALLEVGDQSREPRIDLAGVLADFFMVLLVRVPAVGAHFDERNARLDQAAGQQAALAERCPPVGVAERVGFVVEVEGPHVRRKDHPGGLAVKRFVVADPVAAPGALEARPLDPLEQAQPAAEAVGPDPGLRVLGRLLCVLDHERLDRRSEKARADGRSADADDVRQVEFAFAQLTDHRSSRGAGA